MRIPGIGVFGAVMPYNTIIPSIEWGRVTYNRWGKLGGRDTVSSVLGRYIV